MSAKLKKLLFSGDVFNSQPVDASIEVTRKFGTGVFETVTDEEGNEAEAMVGVEYFTEETRDYLTRNGDALAKQIQLGEKDKVVVLKSRLDMDEMFTTIALKRKQGVQYGMNDYFAANQMYIGDELMTVDSYLKRLGMRDNKPLQFLVDTSVGYGKRYLIPELIREVIFQAMIETPRYMMLCGNRPARSVPLPESEIPEVFYGADDMLTEDIGESENLPSVEITFGSRKVKVYRRGVRVPINAEVIKYVNYGILAESLRQIGWRLGNQETELCIDTLINGDKPNAGYPVGVMGVHNPSSKIQYRDITRVMLRYIQTGYMPNLCLANEDELERVMNIAEFMRNDKNAGALFSYDLIDGEMKKNMIALPSSQIADDCQLLVDTRYAINQLLLEGLTVVEDHHKRTDQYEYYVRLATGYENADQRAKVLLDGTEAFCTMGYPSYLTLVK